jgi:hypothetical protein
MFSEKEYNHRFVMFEKRNLNTECIINSLKESGWVDVSYVDKYVMLISNTKTKQIILLGCTTRVLTKYLDGFASFGKNESTGDDLTIMILLDINFKSESSWMKYPDFIELNTNALFQYSKVIKTFKERLMKHDKGNLSHNGINKFIRKHRNQIKYNVDIFKNNLIKEKEKHYVC